MYMYSPSKVAIIGGGILGLATARELLIRGVRPLTVLEAEPILASHQSGRNSGVVHAGIYYAPNSLKATLCLEGLQRSYHYFDQHQIPYKKTGKLIVALDRSELSSLETLFQNAQINGVPDMQFLHSTEEIHHLQPGCAGIAAIFSPHTGIVDWAAVARSYADQVRSMGGTIQTSSRVFALEHNELIDLHVQTPTARKVVKTERVISCAGVQSDRVAALLNGVRDPAIIPVRGEYLRITNPDLASTIRMNIYPVPDSGSGSPFLGVHFTPTLSGDVIVGPNAVLAFSRNGYKASDFSWRDINDMVRYPGFWRLASRFWKFGAREAYRSAFISSAARAARKYVPAVQVSDFERQGPERSGIRAQAVSMSGALVDDFVFESAADGRVLHTRNAPSPGATSSLAIARVIADKSLEAG